MYDAPHFNNLFIDHAWEPALGTCPTEDPKTGQTLHLLPEADADQVHRAVLTEACDGADYMSTMTVLLIGHVSDGPVGLDLARRG